MSAKAIELTKAITKHIQSTKGFDRCMSKLTFTPCEEGRSKAHFTVGEEHLNIAGVMHGGFIGTLVDFVSTNALVNSTKDVKRGVSVGINVNYMRSAKQGDNVEVEAYTVKIGKNLAFLNVELRNQDTNKLIATGTHTKFLG